MDERLGEDARAAGNEARGPIRIDLGFVNAYLLPAAEGFVLVDAGTPAHYAKLEAALGRAGCGKGDLRLIVLSHADPDHGGCAAALAAAYGAPIALHPGELPQFERGETPRRSGRGLAAKLFVAFTNRPGKTAAAGRSAGDTGSSRRRSRGACGTCSAPPTMSRSRAAMSG